MYLLKIKHYFSDNQITYLDNYIWELREQYFSTTVFGSEGGAFARDEHITHSRFSEFLPWVAYNTDTQMYYLRDNAACWIFEASQLVLATPETYKTFADIYKTSFPEGIVIQSIIYADPYVDDILDSFMALREQNEKINPLFMAGVDKYY